MFTVAGSIEIQRPTAEVFRFAGDYRNDPEWRRGVVTMRVDASGMPEIGTKTTEAMLIFGRLNSTIAEVVEFEEGRRTAFRSLEGPVPLP